MRLINERKQQTIYTLECTEKELLWTLRMMEYYLSNLEPDHARGILETEAKRTTIKELRAILGK